MKKAAVVVLVIVGLWAGSANTVTAAKATIGSRAAAIEAATR